MSAMQKTLFIKEIAPGDEVASLFLLTQASQGQAKNGPFWRLELKDRSGSLEAKIWSPLSQQYQELSPGCLVQAAGRASLYRDRLELNIEELQVLGEDAWHELDAALFMPAAPRLPDEMWHELEKLCASTMRHPPWKKFIQLLFGDEDLRERWKIAPAAKGVHHAYRGGLLEHTLGVARLCLKLADSYPQLDRQLLLAGAVCHDLGKLWEFSGLHAIDYTDSGRLLGHIELGLEAIAPYLQKSGLEPELAMHLKHLIISHHGELEYGSPKRPKTAEAFALHFADNIDARMAQLRELFDAMPSFAQNSEEAGGFRPEGEGRLDGITAAGAAWTPFQATLSRFLYRAVPSPEGRPEENASARSGKRRTRPENKAVSEDGGAGRSGWAEDSAKAVAACKPETGDNAAHFTEDEVPRAESRLGTVCQGSLLGDWPLSASRPADFASSASKPDNAESSGLAEGKPDLQPAFLSDIPVEPGSLEADAPLWQTGAPEPDFWPEHELAPAPEYEPGPEFTELFNQASAPEQDNAGNIPEAAWPQEDEE